MYKPNRLSLALAIAISPTLAFANNELASPDSSDSSRKATTLASVEVIGTPEKQAKAPGSATVIDETELQSSRVLTVNEALRKVPGVNVRDEEGFGLRPNIGIRGLNPTRSTKVLLLEDGIPAMYAPYGDNATYYHAPIERYSRIEVLKGTGILRFGPQTVGGIINYITPEPSEEFMGHAQLSIGTRDYYAFDGMLSANGFLIDFNHKQGDGARDNTNLKQSDIFAKYVADITDNQAITLRANFLKEDSQVGYTGITDAELANFGAQYNPFGNDNFDITHHALSLTHEWRFNDNSELNTSAYYSDFLRDWWRQSSTTTDTQCGNAFRDARLIGSAINPDACNSVQGRLRDYYTRGIEPRLSLQHGLFNSESTLEAGLRYHTEVQERQQINGVTPTARIGTLAEDNRREVQATSAYLSNTFTWNDFSLVPSIRRENINFYRMNRLTNLSARSEMNETVAGLGMVYKFSDAATLFAGTHEGFAPPRVEDIINNAGGSVDVDAERSRNSEIGLRGAFAETFNYEATVFRNDFSNQVVVGSIAGGSTPLAQGETLYQGFETAISWNKQALQTREGEFYANISLTWLPIARLESPFVAVVDGAVVGGSAAGNRLPYAPETTATLRLGYTKGAWDASIEMQTVSSQYADFANTRLPLANGSGQIGKIDGYNTFSATLNYVPAIDGWSGFISIKNLTDREYIVDRTRGILLGNPRQVVAGIRYAF
jgi:Fe(3+) dicitrate transport protein